MKWTVNKTLYWFFAIWLIYTLFVGPLMAFFYPMPNSYVPKEQQLVYAFSLVATILISIGPFVYHYSVSKKETP